MLLPSQTQGAAEGNITAMQPLDDPVTEEMELLSKSFSQMALSLHERSEYIREFASYVSHEFKTPLTAIQGASELLLEHYEEMSPDKRRKFIENMLNGAYHHRPGAHHHPGAHLGSFRYYLNDCSSLSDYSHADGLCNFG